MSSLEARVAKLEKVAAPDDKLCVTVEITRQGSHLLTAGEESSGEAQRSRKRQPRGHVHNERCIRVSINRRIEPEPAVSEGTRGDSDRPRLAPPAPADASAPPTVAEGALVAVRAPAGVYGDGGADGSAAPEPPARDAVVEMVERSAPPALVSPLEVEMRQEAAAVSRSLSRDLEPSLAWWLPVAEAPLGLCAVLYCGHPALEHRGPRTRLPCSVCGFRAEQHDADGIALEVPQHARRVSPCPLYRAIHVDEIDGSDKCEVPGCGCRGWRRWLPHDPRSELASLKARLEEKDRIIADNTQKLARLRTEYEAAERELLRATSGPSDLGASPHGCPVYQGEQ